jgi:alpha-ketoglutarate-dependent taurine dioxygenase
VYESVSLSDRPWGRLLRATGPANLLDLEFEQVAEALREFGALLVRGFETGPGFAEFADRFSDTTLDRLHGGQNRREVPGDDKTSTVNLGTQLIGPHAELAYSPRRPDLLWFHCARPSASDGQTTLFDGIEVLANLPEELRELFAAKDVRYSFADTGPDLWPLFTGETADRNGTAGLLAGLHGVTHVLAGEDTIDISYRVSAARPSRYQGVPAFANSLIPTAARTVTFDDGTPIPPRIRLSVLRTCNRLMTPIEWQAGDVVLIDNSRMMHGRLPFEDAAREIHVRMSMAAF